MSTKRSKGLKVISRLQREFRNRLFTIRQEQLIEADIRAAQAKADWLEYTTKLKRWRDYCNVSCCEHCGGKVHVQRGQNDLGKMDNAMQCMCNSPVPLDFLVGSLRRLAGIGPGHAAQKTEWDDWNKGPEGFRKCGPALWDDSIRALEEDM